MASTSLLGLAIKSFLADLPGGIVGKTKALVNLGKPSYIFSSLKAIASPDLMSQDSDGYKLVARDMYSLRNIRSALQTQIDAFQVKITAIKNLLSSLFPSSIAKSTVAMIMPANGSLSDLQLKEKTLYQYDANGNQLSTFVKDPIKFTPISATECLLDLGTSNGYSNYILVNGTYKPETKTGPEEAIYDFDVVTIQWVEGAVNGVGGVTKKRFDMQIAGPFYGTEDYSGEFRKTDTGSGRFAYVLKMCRGSGDTFASLLAASAQNVSCTIIKKQERKFICVTNYVIGSSDIASIKRTSNVTTIVLKDGTNWLGNVDLASTDISDERVVKNQPLVVRATGSLSDFAGAYSVLSVNRKTRTITYNNFSSASPTTSTFTTPSVEISIEPFYTTQFSSGDAVSMTFLRTGNNSVVDHYTDLIVGDTYNTGSRKGFYLYGKNEQDYIMANYYFDSPLGGWGYRQAAFITNFASSSLKGSSKVFTARQFIRGFATPKSPSFSRGNILSTSTKSFWNRTTSNAADVVLGLSFPGQVQVNGSLEVKQQINFNTTAVLSQYPTSLTGTSTASPYYQYFNKEKDLTHLFQLKVGGETCYLPAVSLEDQVFRYEQSFISKQTELTQTAIVSLDKFYTTGNTFTFQKGGDWKSSTNTTNVFFGELFQPLIRNFSTNYSGQYANVMPTKEYWMALNRLPKNANEASNVSLNAYYETMPSSTFTYYTKEDRSITPSQPFRSAYNGIGAYQNTSNTDLDTDTLMPTNAATFFMVFRIRPDWAETQPDAISGATTPQVIASQGADWETISTLPFGGASTNYYTDNGLGWLLYTKGFDNSNRTLYFTNPGPWNELCDTTSWGVKYSAPTRKLGFSQELALTKTLAPGLFYFLAFTFETRDASNNLISNSDMEANYTATLTPSAYPTGYAAYLPTSLSIDNMRPTTINFYAGVGTSGVVSLTPGSNSLKIIRATKRRGSYSNRFGRRLGVGLPHNNDTIYSLQNGWYNGYVNNVYVPYSYEKFRVACPMDIAMVGQIDDVMNSAQLGTLFSSLRTGTFSGLNWGTPI